MRVCRELGKTLHEYMGWPGPLTHRQHRAWVEFFRENMNEPDRTDHYIMQLTLYVAQFAGMFAKSQPQLKLEQFRLRFERRQPKREPTPEERQKQVAASKAAWFAASGYKPPNPGE